MANEIYNIITELRNIRSVTEGSFCIRVAVQL